MAPYRQPADTRAPDVLLCAGLDPSGGAGFIADTRVVAELGCRPCGVVTSLTVQNTTGVVEAHPLDPDVVGHELAFLLTDLEVKAVKIGMVGSAAIARAIASALQLSAARVVWDPVMYPSRGDLALIDDAQAAMHALAPHLSLVTPNQRELLLMTGLPTGTLVMAEAAARALARTLDTAVLLKGGHFGGDTSDDLLFTGDGEPAILRGPRVPGGEDVHGTGCALSSAIAAHLAHGRELLDASRLAKDVVAAMIASPVYPGRGAGAVR